jgi:hypothetical protein
VAVAEAVKVSWIVADGMGDEEGEGCGVAVGIVFVSVSVNINVADEFIPAEFCGSHAPSTRVIIKIGMVVHVRFNKSPLLFWLSLPVWATSLPEMYFIRLEAVETKPRQILARKKTCKRYARSVKLRPE